MEMQEVKDIQYPKASDSNSLIIILHNGRRLELIINPL